LLDFLRGVRTDGGSTTVSPEVAGPSPETTLFRCLPCESVYVATEKTVCESCETAVEAISSGTER
jgi:hypothetical protein